MRSLLSIPVCLSLGLVGTSGSLLAQSASGADARLQERNHLAAGACSSSQLRGLCACRELAVSCREHGRSGLEVQRQGRQRYHGAGGLRDGSASWANHVSESAGRAW
jgi:hypothetical protein